MFKHLAGALLASAVLAACDGGETCDTACASSTTSGATSGPATTTGSGTQDDGSLEILGSWIDTYGGQHEISETQWTQQFGTYTPLVFHVEQWDNAARWVVARNDDEAAYYAGQYSRFDWVWSDRLYVCQTVVGVATADDAMGAPRADDTDLLAGCGAAGFPWTGLDPA